MFRVLGTFFKELIKGTKIVKWPGALFRIKVPGQMRFTANEQRVSSFSERLKGPHYCSVLPFMAPFPHGDSWMFRGAARLVLCVRDRLGVYKFVFSISKSFPTMHLILTIYSTNYAGCEMKAEDIPRSLLKGHNLPSCACALA